MALKDNIDAADSRTRSREAIYKPGKTLGDRGFASM
jgi:hypothetical protein